MKAMNEIDGFDGPSNEQPARMEAPGRASRNDAQVEWGRRADRT